MIQKNMAKIELLVEENEQLKQRIKKLEQAMA